MRGYSREGGTRGVTPVIATVFLVAIVVVIGGVVGVYVFDIAEETDSPAPQAAFTYDWDKDTRTLTISHASGDPIDDATTRRLVVEIRDDDDTGQNDYLVANRSWVDDDTSGTGPVQSYPVTSGDEFVITGESGGGDLDVEDSGSNVANPSSETHEPEIDDEVAIYWTSEDGEQSYVVSRYTIPAGEDP
jgi:FlaG/FlaF family flagellin (archaellin)